MTDPEQGFTATHEVPVGGLDAWSEADATQPPAARLDPGLQIELLRRWGDWAEIKCSNGWTAWVGGDALQPARDYAAIYQTAQATPATGPVVTPSAGALEGFRFSPALLGAVAAGVGVVLPWFRGIARFENAFGVPAQALIDKDKLAEGLLASGGGLTVGLLVLAAAIGGGVCLYLPGKDKIRRGCGWAAVLLPTMFVGQVQQLVSAPEAQGSGISVIDVVNFGVLVTIGGGLLLALGPGARQP